jgi:DNA polymerase elongation subunit (family B)
MIFDFSSLHAQLDPKKDKRRNAVQRSKAKGAGTKRATAMSANELRASKRHWAQKTRQFKKQVQLQHIAVLDFETDPFDMIARERIAPFAACLYSENFDPIIIWDENEASFLDRVIAKIKNLPGKYLIYAHNGGKFDFLFLISKLRGRLLFKGRGIMSANIGEHEIRDSYHLIPEKLAAYHKDDFDYSKLTKKKRAKNRDDIIRYMVNDCKYTYQIVKAFLQNYGIKLSIGQAAMALIKKAYPEIKSIHENDDAFLRQFFYGGRVECINGRGVWEGEYRLYDVNSMYPAVMANFKHPIGNFYRPRHGTPTNNTFFIDLECFSHGAFPVRQAPPLPRRPP